jgi:hypothetical protein
MKEVMMSGNGALLTLQNMDKDLLFSEPDPKETERLSKVVRKFKREGSYWGEYNLDD